MRDLLTYDGLQLAAKVGFVLLGAGVVLITGSGLLLAIRGGR